MTKTRVTEDRFKSIKIVLNNVRRGQKGLSPLYQALGISSSTASRIKRSATYQDYVELSQSYHNKPAEPAVEPIQPELATPQLTQHVFQEDVIARLDRIEAKIDAIRAMLIDESVSENIVSIDSYGR